MKLRIEQPPEDILDRRLAELGSELEPVRRAALADLRYFPVAAEKVVPALIASLDDESRTVRTTALSALMAFPAAATDHADRILAIVKNGDLSVSERYSAAVLLARHGPLDEEVGRAIEAASAGAPEGYRPAYGTALLAWKARVAAAGGPESPPR